MADYYTEFSVMLPFPEGEDAKQKVYQWSDALLGKKYEVLDNDPDNSEYIQNVHWEVSDDGLWVYSEDSEGDPEDAATFIQQYLSDMNIEGGIFMSIAGYCSKPRINEAWGAAVVITKNDQLWLNVGEVLRQAAEAGVEVLNA